VEAHEDLASSLIDGPLMFSPIVGLDAGVTIGFSGNRCTDPGTACNPMSAINTGLTIGFRSETVRLTFRAALAGAAVRSFCMRRPPTPRLAVVMCEPSPVLG
jgi:hypothetical protein